MAAAGRRASGETGAKTSSPLNRGTGNGKANTPGILGLPCLWKECKVVQPFWKRAWQVFINCVCG